MPAPLRTLTKAERDRAIAYHDLACTMRELEADLRWGLNDSQRIPAEWRAMLMEPAVARKVKLTLRLDEDVVAFFRSMGPFHLTRMNRVLRAFMLARLAGVATGPEMVGYRPTAAEEARSLRREVLDRAAAEMEARERAEAEAAAEAKGRGKLERLRGLRDRR